MSLATYFDSIPRHWETLNLSHSCATFLLSWASQNHYHISKEAGQIAFVSCSGGLQHSVSLGDADDSDFNFSALNSSYVDSNSKGNSWILFCTVETKVVASLLCSSLSSTKRIWDEPSLGFRSGDTTYPSSSAVSKLYSLCLSCTIEIHLFLFNHQKHKFTTFNSHNLTKHHTSKESPWISLPNANCTSGNYVITATNIYCGITT